MEIGQAEEVAAEVEMWRKLALSYWQGATDKHEGHDPAKKLKRVKSCSWLVASEAMLRHVLGINGWLAFQVKKRQEDPFPPHPDSWPGVSVVIDQGSDGWCAGNFMCNKLLLNTTIIKDGAHRAWNDVCLALKESSLWFLIVSFNCVCSVDNGPWQDSRWFVEAQEASRTYCELSKGASCPLWQVLYPKIAQDRGDCPNGEESEVADMWRLIPEAASRLLCMTLSWRFATIGW